MSRITDYGFLFQTTFGTSKTNLVNIRWDAASAASPW